jgi:hypothetical protein
MGTCAATAIVAERSSSVTLGRPSSADEVPYPGEMRRHALSRLEILDALVSALDRREQLVQIVALCTDAGQARRVVIDAFNWNEVQATAVLDLHVRRFARGSGNTSSTSESFCVARSDIPERRRRHWNTHSSTAVVLVASDRP